MSLPAEEAEVLDSPDVNGGDLVEAEAIQEVHVTMNGNGIAVANNQNDSHSDALKTEDIKIKDDITNNKEPKSVGNSQKVKPVNHPPAKKILPTTVPSKTLSPKRPLLAPQSSKPPAISKTTLSRPAVAAPKPKAPVHPLLATLPKEAKKQLEQGVGTTKKVVETRPMHAAPKPKPIGTTSGATAAKPRAEIKSPTKPTLNSAQPRWNASTAARPTTVASSTTLKTGLASKVSATRAPASPSTDKPTTTTVTSKIRATTATTGLGKVPHPPKLAPRPPTSTVAPRPPTSTVPKGSTRPTVSTTATRTTTITKTTSIAARPKPVATTTTKSALVIKKSATSTLAKSTTQTTTTIQATGKTESKKPTTQPPLSIVEDSHAPQLKASEVLSSTVANDNLSTELVKAEILDNGQSVLLVEVDQEVPGSQNCEEDHVESGAIPSPVPKDSSSATEVVDDMVVIFSNSEPEFPEERDYKITGSLSYAENPHENPQLKEPEVLPQTIEGVNLELGELVQSEILNNGQAVLPVEFENEKSGDLTNAEDPHAEPLGEPAAVPNANVFSDFFGVVEDSHAPQLKASEVLSPTIAIDNLSTELVEAEILDDGQSLWPIEFENEKSGDLTNAEDFNTEPLEEPAAAQKFNVFSDFFGVVEDSHAPQLNASEVLSSTIANDNLSTEFVQTEILNNGQPVLPVEFENEKSGVLTNAEDPRTEPLEEPGNDASDFFGVKVTNYSN